MVTFSWRLSRVDCKQTDSRNHQMNKFVWPCFLNSIVVVKQVKEPDLCVLDEFFAPPRWTLSNANAFSRSIWYYNPLCLEKNVRAVLSCWYREVRNKKRHFTVRRTDFWIWFFWLIFGMVFFSIRKWAFCYFAFQRNWANFLLLRAGDALVSYQEWFSFSVLIRFITFIGNKGCTRQRSVSCILTSSLADQSIP